MSWEWSHTIEAYQNARENLGRRSLRILIEIAAEWKAQDPDEFLSFNETLFQVEKKRLQTEAKAGRINRDTLADVIWDNMEKLRTCDNGGHNAHCCPFGCIVHQVSFSTPQELMQAGKEAKARKQ